MKLVRQCHRALDTDEEGEKAYRLKQGDWKRFREEVEPMATVAYAVFGCRDDVTVSLGPRRDPRNPEYDGLIEGSCRRHGTCIYLQVTLALGEQRLCEEKMRMEVLNSSGRVPATGPIWREKQGHRGKKGSIRFEDDADNASSVKRVRDLIIEAIESKREKQDDYPKPIWLVVVCDDLPPSPLAKPDIANARGQVPRLALLSMLHTQQPVKGLRFDRVFLVGQTRGFLQELPFSHDRTAPDSGLEGRAS
jgi:hypothetical protein